MQTRRILLSLIGLAATVAAIAPATARAMDIPDRIARRGEGDITGIRITDATIAGITYVKAGSVPGEPQTVPFDQVKEIRWGDAGQFNIAISEFSRREYDAALKAIDRAPSPGVRDFWFRPYKGLIHGASLVGLGRHKEALPILDEVVTKYPKSFYILDAISAKARAHIALGEFAQAADAFARLDPENAYKDPKKTAPYGKLWQLRGRSGAAEALTKVPEKRREAADTWGGLAQACEAILADPPADLRSAVPEITAMHQSALIGRAEVLLADGKAAEAEDWLGSVASKITEKPVRLRLYMALGDALFEAGKAATKKEDKDLKHKQAMLAYMRIYILYPEQKEERQRAMFFAADASERLETPEDRSRAVRLWKELATDYPGTDWAKKAAAQLEARGIKVK